MASQPPNYFGAIAPVDPNAFIQGIQNTYAPGQLRQNEQIRQLQIANALQELQQEQGFRNEATNVISNPTPEGFRRLMLRYPRQRQAIEQAWNQYSEGEQRRNTEAASSVYAALSNNRPDLALTTLRRRREALTSAGTDTAETDALIQMIESGDPAQIQRARGFAGMVLAASTGPDHIGPTLESLHDVEQPQAYTLGPGEVRYERGPGGEQREVARSPVTVRSFTGPDGITYDIVPDTAPAGDGTPAPPGPSAARGSAPNITAINNPGALRDGPFARSQPGYRGSQNGFARFETAEQGIRAQEVLLRSRYLRQPQTAQQIAGRYAPPRSRGGDNSEESTRNYGTYIERRLNLRPGQRIDASRARELAAAMREWETGNTVPTRQAAPVRVRSVQEARALPPGTHFLAPNGREYIR